MPYKIQHRGSGFKVTTPNHPGGFSKHSLSKKKAVAQLRAIKMHAHESWVEAVIHGYWPEAVVDRLLDSQAKPGGRYDKELKRHVSWWEHEGKRYPRTLFPAGTKSEKGETIDMQTGEVKEPEKVKECAGTVVAALLHEEEFAIVQFVSPNNTFWWYTATAGDLWTREDARAKLLPASKANEIVQNLNAVPAYKGRVGAIARNQAAGAPPKADIMPGGSVGSPIGDNTAIGVAGGGGV
jgi:hypothetical protein